MKGQVSRLLPVLAVVLLGGCATAPGPGSTARGAPKAPQARPAQTFATMPQAALSLAKAADRAAGKHDWALASRQLERAVKIAPRNPLLWQRLAAVRFSQGKYGQAQTFALKSNAYAAGDAAVERLNWRIIAAARSALGDTTGAAAAERHVSAL